MSGIPRKRNDMQKKKTTERKKVVNKYWKNM